MIVGDERDMNSFFNFSLKRAKVRITDNFTALFLLFSLINLAEKTSFAQKKKIIMAFSELKCMKNLKI